MVYLHTQCVAYPQDRNYTILEHNYYNQIQDHERDFVDIYVSLRRILQNLKDSCESNGRNAINGWLDDNWATVADPLIKWEHLIISMFDALDNTDRYGYASHDIEQWLQDNLWFKLKDIQTTISNYMNFNFNLNDSCYKWKVGIIYGAQIINSYPEIIHKQMPGSLTLVYYYGDKMTSMRCDDTIGKTELYYEFFECYILDDKAIKFKYRNLPLFTKLWHFLYKFGRYPGKGNVIEKNC